MSPIIIIGAGLAGWTTAREFRKLDATTPVLLITADSGDFYAKPSLSNAFAQKRDPAQLVTTPAARMAETLAVTLQTHNRDRYRRRRTHGAHQPGRFQLCTTGAGNWRATHPGAAGW